MQVAVLSARKHAPDLLPVLLYPGTLPSRLTDWLEANGGLVFQHRSVLLPRWEVCKPHSPTLVCESTQLPEDDPVGAWHLQFRHPTQV